MVGVFQAAGARIALTGLAAAGARVVVGGMIMSVVVMTRSGGGLADVDFARLLLGQRQERITLGAGETAAALLMREEDNK